MEDYKFKNHFSDNSKKYSKYRPGYPGALFEFLSSVTPGHDLAWDCATGTGQAALELVKYFNKVIASDASEQQIKNTIQHEKISYNVAPAHKTTIAAESVDLITVAQALHWFEFNRFYGEAKRVLKRNGIIAAWTYNLVSVSLEIDSVIKHFYINIVGEFWPPERKFVENGYESIPFPFHRLGSPSFSMTAKWTNKQLIHYIGTWSAVRNYKKSKGRDPVEWIEKELTKLWDNHSLIMEVYWPLSIVIGKNKQN
jgi:ubiquinone/menaquinone biosynthesis C-methylase UbiE